MTEAEPPGPSGKPLLKTFAWAFTCRGFHRFAEWMTAMVLNVEEHTITESVLALEQLAAWKALASFAEYGSGHQDRVTWGLTRLIATARGELHEDDVSAVDDTKVTSLQTHVWGTCTLHEYRPPAGLNRAATVCADNWVVSGALLPEPEKPRGSCRSPAGLTSASRSCRSDPRVSWISTPRRTGRRVALRAGPHHQGQAFGRFRRRLRLGERGPAAGPARRRVASDRDPSPARGAMPGCTPCPCPGAVPRGGAGTEARVG